MSLTAVQKKAIAARGNVLLDAGAGTGKTKTLVERCLHWMFDDSPPLSLGQVVMVTFTDAAGAEIRKRIRQELEARLDTSSGTRVPSALQAHLREELALFDSAHIGTLHRFCFQLVRQYFYELEIDPQAAVMAEEETWLVAEETLETVLERYYSGRQKGSEAVQQLIQSHGANSDRAIRDLVLRVHHFTQTQPNPAAWFETETARFSSTNAVHWQELRLLGLQGWRERWLTALERAGPANAFAAQSLAALKSLSQRPDREQASPAFAAIEAALKAIPRGKKTTWTKGLSRFLGDTEFLQSICAAEARNDPLEEDWKWAREPMLALLGLARDFEREFSQAKRELGLLDFHDLEQHALRLLWDATTGEPSAIAREWQHRIRLVFVDEYQDINAAQDRIIQALSRTGERANRFLVGDVKQSIYRFRLADPAIFQRYMASWHADRGAVIPLTENFRSRQGILNFVNSLFGPLMRRELGGVDYDSDAELMFGAAAERSPLAAQAGSPAARLLLRVKGPAEVEAEEEGANEPMLFERGEDEKEARIVALELLSLKMRGQPVWEETTKSFRPVEWSDMVVLLRAPSGKTETYAREFARVNIPLLVARARFYESLEILDLLNLLQILDNPLQDLPLLAVLRSPFVSLSAKELATIRLSAANCRFWVALEHWHETNVHRVTPETKALLEKVSVFLDRYAEWRRLARQESLCRCLETILEQSQYEVWLAAEPHGRQRLANVQRLLSLAQEFDHFQRQGLFRFLRFIDAQRQADTEPEVAQVIGQNAVRLMSIHQSKGLEFPVVALCHIGKDFNFQDLRKSLILDEVFGLCPQVTPPQTNACYPSIAHWLAADRQLRETLGEELRLLYVALTRARDCLLLSGTVSRSRFKHFWQDSDSISTEAILAGKSFADWLGLWFGQRPSLRAGPFDSGAETIATEGQDDLLSWKIFEGPEVEGTVLQEASEPAPGLHEILPAPLLEKLSWRYPFLAATQQPAKATVTSLRRESLAAEEAGEVLFTDSQKGDALTTILRGRARARGKSAADIGTAHHKFLQFVSLSAIGSVPELKREALRLEKQLLLTPAESNVLDYEAIVAFWNSSPGQEVLAHAAEIRRELSFTARFSLEELAAVTGHPAPQELSDEFVVVQGMADLVVMLPSEIWLIDFKTDALRKVEVAEKAKFYEPQLRLYAESLRRIYRKPVTRCVLYFLDARIAVEVGAVSSRKPLRYST